MSIFKTDWSVGNVGHAALHNTIGAALNQSGYNVKWFGAVGDGETDDTSAIADAITAMPAAGGVLFFPPGTYKTSGGFTIAKPMLIVGCGMASYDGVTGAVTTVTCTSATASLFTVTATKAKFQDIALVNTAVSTPSDGAGITVTPGDTGYRTDFESVSVEGFYIDINVQGGVNWTMHGCYLHAPVQYGLKISNIVNPDEGDWSISDTSIFSALYDSQSGIYIASSGGGKISNVKINRCPPSPFMEFVNGIEVVPAGESTSILMISNTSIENVSGNGIQITTNGFGWDFIKIEGNQFNAGGVNITCANVGEVDSVVIANNIFSLANPAIALTKVNNAVVGPNIVPGTELSQTSCTNIRTVTTA